MPTPQNAVRKAPIGAERSENVALNFVLAGYFDPKAMPGVTPTRQQALAAMAAMRKRAMFEAHLVGAAHTDAADEGLSQALQELGGSRIAERYIVTWRGVRPYGQHHQAIQRASRDSVCRR